MTISANQLANACHLHPDTAALWLEPLNTAMTRFRITSPAAQAAFLAQTAHESARFTRGRENLRYTTEKRLLEVFGGEKIPRHRRITPENVARFVGNPERLANYVYANRFGNGRESSGDGWRYRGGGPMGLTFRDNYRACGVGIGYPLEDRPELIAQPDVGALAAAWFWNSRRCTLLAEAGQFDEITRRINGGTNGAEDRRILWASAKAALNIA